MGADDNMKKEDIEKEYILDFFKEKGFVRKKCRVCGEYFWTLDPDLDNCQDAPCTPYFFDKISSRAPLTVRESRTKFLGYFEKQGHRIVEPKPVVARWREDLYLTIASIVDFQPHVTNGIVPPPANPLVVSQPCIRLEDIDSVGLTMGRHLTLFEMGGHHAFNRKDGEWVYWKDETLEYALDFFTREIGVPEEKIVFKESWWTGGGNAGPSFEVAVGGLELATLVFMKYKTENGRLEPIPLQIVDTGYGIERIAWFTQKTPTAFHAIYPGLIEEYRKLLKLDSPPEGFYEASFRMAGLLDPESDQSVSTLINKIAVSMGVTVGEAKEILEKEVRLYTLLDHTKTLAYMLADGIVPSNQGEGYLARLVARRAMKTLYLFDADVSLPELLEKQIIYWRQDYPRLDENREYILMIAELEERKFRQLIKEKLSKALEKILSSTNKNILKKIYAETGIPPEILVSEASRRGIELKVPRDFYSSLAGEASAPLHKTKDEGKIEEWASSCPPTRRIFHENPYAKRISAKIVCIRENRVVLDRTIVYPTGGGQVSDTGVLTYGEKRYIIKHAEKQGETIIHYLDREARDLKPGDTVLVEIDWDRRYANMRHHTATHIMLGALRKVLGNHVWQAGAEKTPFKARLDITHYELPSKEQLRRIEELANKIVSERLPVKTKMMDRLEAEEKYGLTIYQGGAPLVSKLRIVEIPGHDAEACYGTHLANTGEVGGIKIIGATKLQDGVVRIEYVSGSRTANYAGELEDSLDRIAELTRSSRSNAAKRVEKIIQDTESMKNLLSKYRKAFTEIMENRIKSEARRIGGLLVSVYEDKIGDEKFMMEINKRMVEREPSLIILRIIPGETGSRVEVSMGGKAAERYSADMLTRTIAEEYGGRGGGKKTHAFARIPSRIGVNEAWRLLEKLIPE